MIDTVTRGRQRCGRIRDTIVVLAAALVTPTALAHAVVEWSQPPANGVVAPGELHVRVQFSSRIDVARSRLVLIAPDGRQTTLAPDAVDKPGLVTATTRVACDGRFTLHWQVLSLDGHVTRGDVPFRVGGAAR